MGYPKVIVSNQKEESISIQRVKIFVHCCDLLYAITFLPLTLVFLLSLLIYVKNISLEAPTGQLRPLTDQRLDEFTR